MKYTLVICRALMLIMLWFIMYVEECTYQKLKCKNTLSIILCDKSLQLNCFFKYNKNKEIMGMQIKFNMHEYSILY